MDIAEYRRLSQPTVDLTGLLLGEPALSDDAGEVLAQVEAERKDDAGRPIDPGGRLVTHLVDTNILSEIHVTGSAQM